MNSFNRKARQLDRSKHTDAFWRAWRAFKQDAGNQVRRNRNIPHEGARIAWELIERANHVTGMAFAGNRGLGVDTTMDKDTANNMLHILHEQRAIDLEP